MQLLILPNGDASCLYDESIDLSQLGGLSICRASWVEPSGAGEWFVDLSPVAGPALGPFASRSLALAAEQDWLLSHWRLLTLIKPATDSLVPRPR